MMNGMLNPRDPDSYVHQDFNPDELSDVSIGEDGAVSRVRRDQEVVRDRNSRRRVSRLLRSRREDPSVQDIHAATGWGQDQGADASQPANKAVRPIVQIAPHLLVDRPEYERARAYMPVQPATLTDAEAARAEAANDEAAEPQPVHRPPPTMSDLVARAKRTDTSRHPGRAKSVVLPDECLAPGTSPQVSGDQPVATGAQAPQHAPPAASGPTNRYEFAIAADPDDTSADAPGEEPVTNWVLNTLNAVDDAQAEARYQAALAVETWDTEDSGLGEMIMNIARPMITLWLEEHLDAIVERVVRQQVMAAFNRPVDRADFA